MSQGIKGLSSLLIETHDIYIHFKQLTICPQQVFWNDVNTFRLLRYLCCLARVASA